MVILRLAEYSGEDTSRAGMHPTCTKERATAVARRLEGLRTAKATRTIARRCLIRQTLQRSPLRSNQYYFESHPLELAAFTLVPLWDLARPHSKLSSNRMVIPNVFIIVTATLACGWG